MILEENIKTRAAKRGGLYHRYASGYTPFMQTDKTLADDIPQGRHQKKKNTSVR